MCARLYADVTGFTTGARADHAPGASRPAREARSTDGGARRRPGPGGRTLPDALPRAHPARDRRGGARAAHHRRPRRRPGRPSLGRLPHAAHLRDPWPAAPRRPRPRPRRPRPGRPRPPGGAGSARGGHAAPDRRLHGPGHDRVPGGVGRGPLPDPGHGRAAQRQPRHAAAGDPAPPRGRCAGDGDRRRPDRTGVGAAARRGRARAARARRRAGARLGRQLRRGHHRRLLGGRAAAGPGPAARRPRRGLRDAAGGPGAPRRPAR